MMGMLVKGLGADHVVWGTDAIWTGAPQWQIEALRRLEIPEDMQKKYGFAPLGPADGPIKRAIFGENSARLYKYDAKRRAELTTDRIALAQADYRARGAGADQSPLRLRGAACRLINSEGASPPFRTSPQKGEVAPAKPALESGGPRIGARFSDRRLASLALTILDRRPPAPAGRPARPCTQLPDSRAARPRGPRAARSVEDWRAACLFLSAMASLTPRRRLGQILVEAGTISAEALEAALVRQKSAGEKIGEALVAMGAASADDVLRALALQHELPFLCREELPSRRPSSRISRPSTCASTRACPIALEGSTVTVATADPTNPLLLDDLRQTLGAHVTLCVAPAGAILEAIERTYGGAPPRCRRSSRAWDRRGRRRGREEDVNQLRDMAFEAPVVRLVNLLIEEAVAAEASDIHIEPFEDTLRVRYRIDGILYDQEAPPRRLQAALTSRIKLMAEMNIAERRLPQDGRIRVTLARPARRHPRLDRAHRPRRVDRDAAPRPLVGVPALRPARLRAGDGASASTRLIRRPARHPPRHRAHRLGQDHHALRRARQDQLARQEDHHDRGPRRVPAQGREPDPGAAEDRAHLRQRAAPHRPPGPRRHHGRRDPRPRDGGDRHPGRAHRPPRLLHPAHQRRARRRHAASGHGRRAVPRRLGARAACSPSGSCGGSAQACRAPYEPDRGATSSPSASTDAARRGALPRQGLRRLPRHRLPRAHRASTSSS